MNLEFTDPYKRKSVAVVSKRWGSCFSKLLTHESLICVILKGSYVCMFSHRIAALFELFVKYHTFVLSALMQSAIFGNMTAVIQKLYAVRARFHAKAAEIKQFVRLHRIENDLKRRIEDFFLTHWSVSKGVDSDEVGISLSKLHKQQGNAIVFRVLMG